MNLELTDRQKEVLTLVVKGKTAREIGEELGLSHRTAEFHRKALMNKLRVNTIPTLVACAIRNRLV